MSCVYMKAEGDVKGVMRWSGLSKGVPRLFNRSRVRTHSLLIPTMALSSNWAKLQANNADLKGGKKSTGKAKNTGKEKKGSAKNVVKKNAGSTKNIVKKNTSYKKTERPGKKPSKIMSMVYSMNDAIKQHAVDKREGKAFEFKTEEAAAADQDGSAVPDFDNLPSSKKAKDIGKFVAMDCEFVGVGPEGKDSALARLSITNFYGHVVMDEFVKPRETVTDWRTWVSGVKPEHMKNAISFKDAQEKCSKILEGRILVGHAIKHDLEALLLSHPRSMIRDTARHLPFRKQYAQGKSPSLKKLAKEILKVDIQDGQHSSVEDARMTMLIYKSDKKEFERLHRSTFSS